MAPRKRAEPATDRKTGNELVKTDNIAEHPGTVSYIFPGASRRKSDPITLNSRGSGRGNGPDLGSFLQNRGKAKTIPNGRARAEPSVRVDDAYHESKPSHGKPSKEPIFSLGRPLPHMVRWTKKPTEIPPRHLSKSPEDLAELGRVELSGVSSPDIEKQGSIVESENTRFRQTAAGTAHSDKRNDAGQPVFDYQPGEDNPTHRERTDDTHGTAGSRGEDHHNYAIGSEPLGQQEHNPVEQREKDPDELLNSWGRIRAKYPKPLAEFLAAVVAIFMGLGATLSVNLSADQDLKYGSYETSCWAWGFAWMFGIYVGGGISGAHMNPAISICLSIFRGFPLRSCLIYVLVQFVAGFVAGALAFGIYKDSIRHVDPTMAITARSFFSTPKAWVSPVTAFFDQVVGGAIMTIAVMALGDDQNNPPGAGMQALVIGLLVTALKFTLGYNIGSALNPASDFGPRVVAYAVGCRGPEVFSTFWWLYGPWGGTLFGSLIGCILYDVFVFIGPESPINYRRNWKIRKHLRKLFSCLIPNA